MRWFVSRHPGAIAWIDMQNLHIDNQVSHLDLEQIAAGDWVFGSLPVHMAAKVCAKGAFYVHLQINMPHTARGQELSAQDLCDLGAHLVAFNVEPLSLVLTAAPAAVLDQSGH